MKRQASYKVTPTASLGSIQPAVVTTARGYGESQPISENSTSAGRAQNRRVVMQVLQNPGDIEVGVQGE